MGVGQRKSKGGKGGHKAKNKVYKKIHATKNRRKDVDQIQDELAAEEEKGEETVFEIDDDLPGQGQFYCTPCARHFTDAETKRVHIKSKLHKRRRVIVELFHNVLPEMKDVAQEQYTQAEAERAAGMTREKYPPAHPVGGAASQTGAGSSVGAGVTSEGTGASGGAATSAGATGMDDDDPDL
ncbi:unnamed protein product [Sphacelaria rigidula]